jgi:hypothetical protein
MASPHNRAGGSVAANGSDCGTRRCTLGFGVVVLFLLILRRLLGL